MSRLSSFFKEMFYQSKYRNNMIPTRQKSKGRDLHKHDKYLVFLASGISLVEGICEDTAWLCNTPFCPNSIYCIFSEKTYGSLEFSDRFLDQSILSSHRSISQYFVDQQNINVICLYVGMSEHTQNDGWDGAIPFYFYCIIRQKTSTPTFRIHFCIFYLTRQTFYILQKVSYPHKKKFLFEAMVA